MTRKEPDEPHLLERELTGQIIGAFFECYNRLEFGYLESVYRRALVVELQLRGLRCAREGLIEVIHKGVCVGHYRYDLLVDGRVLVEVKSSDSLPSSAKRQLRNYLRGTGLQVGLLLHFGPEAKFHRCVQQRFAD